MFYLVTFDISDDRVRYRVVKTLKGCCSRVQKSVFECPDITERQFLKLKDAMESLMDETTDSVRYYRLCRKCIREVEYSGHGEAPGKESFLVV